MSNQETIDILQLLNEPFLDLIRVQGLRSAHHHIDMLIDDMTYDVDIEWDTDQMRLLLYTRDIIDLRIMGVERIQSNRVVPPPRPTGHTGPKAPLALLAPFQHLVPEVIESVPVDDGCPVCLSSRARLFDRTPCGHFLCQGCSKRHFASSEACPMCRQQVRETTRVRKMPKNAQKGSK
jgi:hypothetical protein